MNVVVNETYDTTCKYAVTRKSCILKNELTYKPTGEGFLLWIFVALEVDIALICASAPTLKPLFKRFFRGTNADVDSYECHKYPCQSYGSGHARTDPEASTQCPEPVKLDQIDTFKNDSRMQYTTHTNTRSRDGHSFTKEDSESEESIIVLQHPDVREIASARIKGPDDWRVLDTWHPWKRKETWSGI